MDYWEYLAHSQEGSTRSGHRYYARELVGNKGGKNVYRYFYTAEEYTAYKKSTGTPGRGTYAETGKSHDAVIWPKGTAKARVRAEAKNHVEQEKKDMDRARAKTSVRAAKVKMDAERYRKQKAEEQSRSDTEARAAQVKKDAKAYREKRRNAIKAKRIGEQHSMDRKRWSSQNATRIGEEHSADMAKKRTEKIAAQVKKDARAYRRKKAQQSVRKQKIRMDAKRYRAQKREIIKKNRDFLKRVMDNTRTRKTYQPKKV